MKKTAFFALLASGAILSPQAAITEFSLQPGGLLGLNERPTPVVTTARGGELEGLFQNEPSISYNDLTKQIFLNFGWGTDHGYADLISDYTASHIHGSHTSDINSAAGVLYDLATVVNLTSAGGRDGGVFQQTITLIDNPRGTGYTIAQQEAQLMAGRWYVNVHSRADQGGFPGGEIRGQLIPVPEPETYAMIAGLGLLAFAGYRRYQAKAA